MSEDEFDLLDELYFVQSFDYLKDVMDWEEGRLKAALHNLYHKGYIKCFKEPDEEIFEGADIEEDGMKYYYLATKKGLMYHNTRD